MGLIKAKSRTWIIFRLLIVNRAESKIAQEVGSIDDLNIKLHGKLCAISRSYHHGITLYP